LAEENVDELIGSPSRVLWNLVDNLGTTRDILRNDATLATHFTYDANGNRTNTGYATGANNQLANDGTFSYTYAPTTPKATAPAALTSPAAPSRSMRGIIATG